MMDAAGIVNVVATLERLTTAYGPRFAPPKLLRDMAQKGETFYGRFGKAEDKRKSA
jgi:3-hydroxyacyl-CoA dehydrogenase/enoyl-CoA hydratase/3-hydroxybutyryl-CoA epimerase